MKKKNYFAAAACSALALLPFTKALAHEARILPADHGSIQLMAGFHVEPPFEDSFNAADVIVSTYDGMCPGSGKAIDVNGTAGAADPDTVNLKVEALYLYKAVRPGGAPIGNIPPAGIEKRLRITDASPLKELYNGPGTYNSWFRPTHPGDGMAGAYGFHVYGTVHAGANSVTCPGGSTYQLAARTATIDSYFVCSSAGSLVPPDAFGCVTAIQPFPGTAQDEYRPNQAFGALGF